MFHSSQIGGVRSVLNGVECGEVITARPQPRVARFGRCEMQRLSARGCRRETQQCSIEGVDLGAVQERVGMEGAALVHEDGVTLRLHAFTHYSGRAGEGADAGPPVR
jgi:hypothetical protein